jgi:trans-aconitate 2-methyltransferase
MTEKNYNWNPQDYEKNSTAQREWAQELLGKLSLKGHERVLDLGCGDGKITAEIASTLPDGQVVGIDTSHEMICLAQKHRKIFPSSRISFHQMDASELSFNNEFDIIFSNAALHWIINHRPLLAGIAKSLKNRGRILLQMGGKGNAVDIIRCFDHLLAEEKWQSYFTNFHFPYGFYGPEEYEIWLKEAGLSPIRIELIPKTMCYDTVEGLKGWLRTTWLPYTERIPTSLHDDFFSSLLSYYLESHPQDQDGVKVKMVRLEVEATLS